jgi:hypothetical protein
MDKAYLMLRRPDPSFSKEPKSDREVRVKIELMDGRSEIYGKPTNL